MRMDQWQPAAEITFTTDSTVVLTDAEVLVEGFWVHVRTEDDNATYHNSHVVSITWAEDSDGWLDEVLVKDREVPAPPAPPEPTIDLPAWDELNSHDQALANQIKGWRTRTARKLGNPPYTIISDQAVLGIVTRKPKPRTKDELLTVKGIGPAKAEKWGDELIRQIKSFD
jgi:superfamily II DNA helicase RecQ